MSIRNNPQPQRGGAAETSDASSFRARFHPHSYSNHDDEDDDENPLHWVVDCVFGLAAVWISFGLWTAVILLYTFVRPFSLTVYRRLVNQIGTGGYLEAMALLLPNTRICLTGDSDIPNPVGTSILVSNHLMNGDWYSLLALGRCVGLRGSIKVFLRNELFHLNKDNNHQGASGPNAVVASSPMRKNNSITSVASVGGASKFDDKHHSTNGSSATNGTSGSISNGHPAPTSTGTHLRKQRASPDLVLAAKFIHSFLEFPLIDEEEYVSDRESLFKLLRSFTNHTEDRRAANVDNVNRSAFANSIAAPVHFLLFPEGWSLYNGENRKSVLARSNDFAKREGRPQLKHLLLPRTTGFNASISSLRESSPFIYDVTIAYRGYKGCVPPQEKGNLSLLSLWTTLRRNYPSEMHIRIKRYSMEEVLQDASWLDKKWAEKDRMLQYFSRHTSFPLADMGSSRRGFGKHQQVFDTRYQSLEVSVMAFIRLALLPWALPLLLFLSIPIVWTTFVVWLLYKGYQYTYEYPYYEYSSGGEHGAGSNGRRTTSSSSNMDENDESTGNSSRVGTPFIPATPFASPSISNWQDMLRNS